MCDVKNSLYIEEWISATKRKKIVNEGMNP